MTDLRTDNYCVILAGGRGRRLWPSSRNDKPKQFIDFFGSGRTLLQSTYDRCRRMMLPQNIFVTVSSDHVHWVREQLPELPAENMLVEPVNRNTAPSVAWAGRRINRLNSQARIIAMPSDQLIVDEEAFCRNVLHGLDFVEVNDIVLTMGIRPTRPEPGYGYIQIGEPSLFTGINKVKSFTEKPERAFAQMFMESGEFLWNTGIFMASVQYLQRFFLRTLPELPSRLSDVPLDSTLDEELRRVRDIYPLYPNISMDKAALELSDDVYVATGDFGWADIGTWHALYECLSKSEADNVVLDSEVVLEDCHNNIIKLPAGHIGVINGLDGYIVAEEGDVLLICKKSDSSALIRKYVNEAGIRYGGKYM